MEQLHLDEVTVSKYWTPRHIDVTDAPISYAKPKASWLERLDQHRPLVPIDSRDRAARRALNTHRVVSALEILELPPLEPAAAPPPAKPPFHIPDLFEPMRTLLRRRTHVSE
jgi:hypothetical protein